MRRFRFNNRGVSNVMAYLFSFTIATFVMISALFITTGIMDNKVADVAGLQAQSVANKIADAILEGTTNRQSMPELNYIKTIDVPWDLAGRSYYVEVSGATVYVNTTDGKVSKSCPTYNAEILNMGISSKRIYSGGGKIDLSYSKPDYVCKLDFGSGDSIGHSPVESGYYMITEESTKEKHDSEWISGGNGRYQYRIPISISNPSSEDLMNVPVKIVLNPRNFDYDKARVSNGSSSDVFSDILLVDPASLVTATVVANPNEWQISWMYRDATEIKVTISELSDFYTTSFINPSTVMLNNQVPISRYQQNVNSLDVFFNAKSAIQSLGGNPPKGACTIDISGMLKDNTLFRGSNVITLPEKIIYVDDDAPDGGNGDIASPFNTIQDAIDAVTVGGTIFVRNGVYAAAPSGILIDSGKDHITLIGESRDGTIIDGNIGGNVLNDHCIKVTTSHVCIDSFTIRNGGATYYGDTTSATAIQLNTSDCHDVIISNCYMTKNYDGIFIDNGAHDNLIINCNSSGNTGQYYGIIGKDFAYGDGIQLSKTAGDYNKIINCTFFDNNLGESDGIKISCKNTIVRGCTMANNGGGIFIYITSGQEDGFNIIENCNIYHNIEGIFIYHKDKNIIRNNSIHDNKKIYDLGIYTDIQRYFGDGIQLMSSDYNNIENCTIYDNEDDGIQIGHKSLVFQPQNVASWNNVSKCRIYDNNCSIFIQGGQYNTIKNCSFYNNKVGIFISYSRSNIIKYCSIFGNILAGIALAPGLSAVTRTILNEIRGCDIHDNLDDGVIIAVGANNNEINNCSIYCNSGNGVTIDGTIFPSVTVKNKVLDCNIYDHKSTGSAGIEIIKSKTAVGTNNIIKRCNFFSNYYGIYMSGSTGFDAVLNSVNHCNFFWNKKHAIYLSQYTHWNYIYYNNFEKNNFPYMGVDGNAHDEATGAVFYNFWDDEYGTITGNHWDRNPNDPGWNYSPFQIATSADAFDYGPLISNYSSDMPTFNPPVFVDDNRPASWYDRYHVKTIQEGINNVSSGGTVYVYNGNYNEFLTINEAVNITGESRDNVILNSGGSANAIYVNSNNVLIDSLNITNSISHQNIGINVYKNALYPKMRININNCSIHNFKYGIYLNWTGIKIKNCNIYDNYEGITITTKSPFSGYNNEIMDCNIYGNTNIGLNLSGASQKCRSNTIQNCKINNSSIGVYIKYGQENTIDNCEIYDNTENGIELEQSADSAANKNTISNCTIDNNQDGIHLHDSSNYNTIKDCTISNNDDGVKIQNSNNNLIYHNSFIENGQQAYDDGAYGTNSWDNGYGTPFNPSTDGGNTWDDSYDLFDNPPALDYYKGMLQDDPGSDGIVDKGYNVTGNNPPNKDRYPFGGSKRMDLRPYHIENWNSNGESNILAEISLSKNSSKYLYLYYGYDGDLSTDQGGIHNHTIGEAAIFSDDFDGLNTGDWSIYPVPPPYPDLIIPLSGNYTINNSGYITTIDNVIPTLEDAPEGTTPSSTESEAMYVVEAKMKINVNSGKKGQGNMILLSRSATSLSRSYLISANMTQQSSKLLLDKHRKLQPTIILDENTIPHSNQWLLFKSYIYLSKTCSKVDESTIWQSNVTHIENYLYNYSSFAYYGNATASDLSYTQKGSGMVNDPPGDIAIGEPYMSGKIGLGCGLNDSSPGSSITVDWIRVIELPVNPPTVSIGPTESINYEWTLKNNALLSANIPGSDPFNPGPVLCDFNYFKDINTGGNNLPFPNFIVRNLPSGKYTITATMGIADGYCDGMSISFNTTQPATLEIPGTKTGEFKTKWVTIDWPGGELNLTFSGQGVYRLIGGGGLELRIGDCLVNAITIERGERGMKIEQG